MRGAVPASLTRESSGSRSSFGESEAAADGAGSARRSFPLEVSKLRIAGTEPLHVFFGAIVRAVIDNDSFPRMSRLVGQ